MIVTAILLKNGSISRLDKDIRAKLITGDVTKPNELISFLSEIYQNTKFDNLVQINIGNEIFYCQNLGDDRYIREDYFSSGEYFLINLYKKIVNKQRYVFIDEIDISLDAAAQVKLVQSLRHYCSKYNVRIFFTTHSLALMRTMENNELYYLENNDGCLDLKKRSYNYIKSVLFGFTGWDRYILTEDEALQILLEKTIAKYCGDLNFEYKIIYIGGADNVVNLMERNSSERFLTDNESVLTVLDGDKEDKRYVQQYENVICIPIQNVEYEIHSLYHKEGSPLPRVPSDRVTTAPKHTFKSLHQTNTLSKVDIVNYVIAENEEEIKAFSLKIREFLTY